MCGCKCVCMRYICIFASLFDSFFHVSALEHHCDLLRYIRINIIIIIIIFPYFIVLPYISLFYSHSSPF